MKKKYRVVEVIREGKLYYEIQWKDFLFWNTETELQVCTDGVSWEESFKIYERAKAIEYVNKMAHNERNVIFELPKEQRKKKDVDYSELIIMVAIGILISCYGISILIAAISCI